VAVVRGERAPDEGTWLMGLQAGRRGRGMEGRGGAGGAGAPVVAVRALHDGNFF